MTKDQETLFNEYNSLAARLRNLGGIVQNDLDEFPITPQDVEGWKTLSQATFTQLKDLLKRTLVFIEDASR